MAVSLSGFALRNPDECPVGTRDCGRTVDPYHACCPDRSYCPTQWNIDCCATSANCTTDLYKDPSCADSTWNLFDNGGYFCCQAGYTAYIPGKNPNSNGCAPPGQALSKGDKELPVIKAGQPSSKFTLQSSTTLPLFTSPPPAIFTIPAPATTTAEASPQAAPAPNAGAIAGTVVGSVAGVALIVGAVCFLLWRRRRSRRVENAPPPPPKEGDSVASDDKKKDGNNDAGELNSPHGVSELGYTWPVQELSPHHGLSELPAGEPLQGRRTSNFPFPSSN